ncbi:MAG: serine protease, partial [Burkholderiales bacterium]
GGLLALLLAGCGGADSGSPSSAVAVKAESVAPDVLRVESRVQPADARQDISPVKSRAVSIAPAPTQVMLGVLDKAKASTAVPSDGAREVGVARALAQTSTMAATSAQLHWQATPIGGQTAAISFSAQDAQGLRLGVQVGQLPGSAMLRVYSQASKTQVFELSGHEILQSIDRNVAAGDHSDAAHTWWTPEFGTAEVTLEIEVPPGTPADAVRIAVPRLIHIYEPLELPPQGSEVAKDVGDADACEQDATCDANFSGTGNAVARMLFVRGDGAFVCTGTLLNDTDSSGAPYFLSAAHCISTQTAASSLQTDWFFRSPSCNARVLSNERVRRLRGAQLLYASNTNDSSFMLLNDAPPANALYAGWDATPQQVGAQLVGLHHAGGDLLKISYGTIDGYSSCTGVSSNGDFSCTRSDATSGTNLRVRWSSGSTEGGSSGSGLFYRQGNTSYLVGTLSGGSASCFNPTAFDYYSRFDLQFRDALRFWLNPAATGTGPAGRTAVYRFFNASTGAHFFTTSVGERDYVASTLREFAYEGPVFYAYPGNFPGQNPVYRFYNPQTRAHFYTISLEERDQVVRTLPAFQYEGISWSAQTLPGNGSVPIYRFFNGQTGTHFYTVSGQERNIVVNEFPAYNFESIGYYAWTMP